MLEPGSIQGTDKMGFGAAFFFSVQTMSTISVILTPATTYGDMLVTIEAAVGLLAVAVATGLIFAKLARPQASVPSAIHGHAPSGRRAPLVFRVGNARGTSLWTPT